MKESFAMFREQPDQARALRFFEQWEKKVLKFAMCGNHHGFASLNIDLLKRPSMDAQIWLEFVDALN